MSLDESIYIYMKPFFDLVFTSSFFICVIILLRTVFRKNISMRLQYSLWLLIVIKLFVFPVPWLESSLSLQNLSAIWTSAPQVSLHDTGFQKQQNSQAHSAQERPTESLQNSGPMNPAENIPASKKFFSFTSARGHIRTITPANHNAREYNRTDPDYGTRRFFFCIAGAGCAVIFLYFGVGNLLFARYLRKKRMLFDKGITPLPVYLVEGLPSPCLFGRAIYITSDIAADKQRLLHVLTHEYCHYRQGDIIWSMLRCLCVVCYWWNPFVWLAARLSKQDCELACDEAALNFLGENERLSYGRTLISLITVKETPKDYFSIATTMTGGGRNMKQRIQRIAKNKKPVFPICILAVCLSVLCFVSACTAVPSSKQTEPEGAINFTEDADQKPEVTSESLEDADPKPDVNVRSLENADQEHAASEPVTDLDKAIGLAILSYNEGRCRLGECPAEGHLKLDETQNPDGSKTVYVLTMYGNYEFHDGYFIKGSGTGIIPVVMDFSYDHAQGYVLTNYTDPMDGKTDSIHALFPEHLWEMCGSYSEDTISELTAQEMRYARQYLDQIGRTAVVGNYPDADHPLLTDAGVSVEVSNSLYEIEKISKYPDWIGNLELIEDGVRYQYEMSLDRTKGEIIYTKTVYDTGAIVEIIRIDMYTGKELS